MNLVTNTNKLIEMVTVLTFHTFITVQANESLLIQLNKIK